jgi:hypothetical protein
MSVKSFVTKSGVLIFEDWRHAVVIDPDLAAIGAKADPTRCARKDLFTRGKARGYAKICSEHSEDRLTWIFFRSLERSGHTVPFLKWCFPTWERLNLVSTAEWLYWHRVAQARDIDPDVNAALAILEPDQRRRGTQHTETDAAVRMSAAECGPESKCRIMVEAKLGNTSDRTGWEKSGHDALRTQYRAPAEAVLEGTSKLGSDRARILSTDAKLNAWSFA